MATEENKPQQELEHEENQENPQDDDTEEEEEDDEDESPPSKLPKLSSDDYSGLVTTAIPSPLGLGLGLALGSGVVEEEATTATSSAAAAAEVKSPFTFMQMQEFHHQNLIYKHMVAGIDVPIHLILPIWKSVAASYGPHHYPSFVGLGSLCYDFRNSMEPEPGRCRRTDGKKWRCSRDVVPDQKYCERHMHRGRNRSRKTVEAAAAVATGAGTNLSIAVADSGSTAESTNSSSGSNHRIGLAPAAAPCNS